MIPAYQPPVLAALGRAVARARTRTMTYHYQPARVACPACAKPVAVTRSGTLATHTDPATHRRCKRSGGRP